MLNNINITSKNLYGKTNLQLVQDTNTLTKNIYETLFVNFINTINVIDEDTNTRFPLASNYVNSNINTGTQTNSEESSVAKVRIKRIKDYIYFLENHMLYKTTIYNIGDGVAVTERRG